MRINWKKELLTIPNLLSFVRILLIPVYIRIYLTASTPGDYLLAGSILTVSCLTDAVDGKIARKYHMVSQFGKLLDPIADKLTQFSLILCLTSRHAVLKPVLALFVVKEAFQLLVLILNLYQGRALPGALMAGKVCTTVLFISLILLVLFPEADNRIVDAAALVNIGFLSFSFASYILAYYGKNRVVEDFPGK